MFTTPKYQHNRSIYLPPFPHAQDKSMECVLMVFTGIREDQIETCLSGLSLDEMDILVKYVYKVLGILRNNGRCSNGVLR